MVGQKNYMKYLTKTNLIMLFSWRDTKSVPRKVYIRALRAYAEYAAAGQGYHKRKRMRRTS